MIYVQLSEEDMYEVEEHALSCIESAGDSKLNMDYGDGRQQGAGRVERNIEGYMAEKAFAKYFDVPAFVQELTEQRNDGGIDIVVKGYKIDVKATRHKTGHMPVKARSLRGNLKPDVFMFGIVDHDTCIVRLVGWLWEKEVKQKYCRKHSPANSYWVEQKDLRKFKDMG